MSVMVWLAPSSTTAHTTFQEGRHSTSQTLSWLPFHQEHVVYTSAHVDSIIGRWSDVLYEFQQRGVFEFESRNDSDHS